MIKKIGDNYRIYGLIIVKIAKQLIVLDYGLSNATFEIANHAFTHWLLSYAFASSISMCCTMHDNIIQVQNPMRV
jgi:hypothetical protein